MQRVAYLDVDGVIADWTGGAAELMGLDASKSQRWDGLEDQLMEIHDIGSRAAQRLLWDTIDEAGPEWWRDLPLRAAGLKLYGVCWTLAPTVFLTSPSANPISYMGKAMFFQKHEELFTNLRAGVEHSFGRFPMKKPSRTVAICPSKEAFAGPTKLLVDDKDKNVERFREAGGHALVWPQPWNHKGRGRSGAGLRSVQHQTIEEAADWLRG